MDAARGAEKVLVRLELRLLMRRCEVRRLTVRDIHQGILEVRGKGRYGGKWRTLAWAPKTVEVIREWEEKREELIEEALQRDPEAQVPDEFLIYRHGARLSAYSDSGLDRLLASAAKRAGIQRKFGHHTLRRTGARFALEADPSILPVLVEVLGHESEAQTRRYCALTVDDMTAMHETVSKRLEEVRQSCGKDPQSCSRRQ